MQRHDAVRALEIYRRAGDQVQCAFLSYMLRSTRCASFVLILVICDMQAVKLSEFFEICRNLDFGSGHKYVKIEKVVHLDNHRLSISILKMQTSC